MKLLSVFSRPQLPPVEKWANHNAKKATPDDLIAGAIVASFAKDYKHWKFVGEFEQNWSCKSQFRSTSLSRKMVGKKHVEIVFVFKETKYEIDHTYNYRYKAIGCEVNGIAVSQAAFRYIFSGWNDITLQVRRTEEAAEKAKKEMDVNEEKWNLAEGLLGMKRNGVGLLMPVKTVEEGQ